LFGTQGLDLWIETISKRTMKKVEKAYLSHITYQKSIGKTGGTAIDP